MRQGLYQALRMALAAIHCRVFSPQPEVRQVVVEVIGIDIPEGVLIVAIHAFVPEFIIVGILVAGDAITGADAQPVLKDAGRRGAHIVASGTIDPLVRPLKRESRLAVVESFYLAQRRKRLFRVALFAIRAQVVLMDIRMATVAIGGLQPGKNLKFLSVPGFFPVALDARHFPVFAHKGEARLAVVEFAGRRKSLGDVAARAIVRQRFLMVILMAGSTLPAQAQKGLLPFFQGRLIDKVGDVALAAIHAAVRPRQFITGQVVVEISFVKAHHVEIPAVMLAVALGAVPASYFPRGMVACLTADEALYFFMAGQAFIIGHFLAQRMALRTIGYPFQVGMRAGQGPGRQLGMQLRKEKSAHQSNDIQNASLHSIGIKVEIPKFF